MSSPAESIAVFSGEGSEGSWTWYDGEATLSALRARLEAERAGGDRWASAWIVDRDAVDTLPGSEDRIVLVKLGPDLEHTGDQRSIPEWLIKGRRV